METEMFANLADRIVDLAIFIRAEVENIDFTIGAVKGDQNCVDAILHIQIRFSLMAVSQNVQMFGVLAELPPKIEYMPVRVTLTKNRYEAKNVTLHSKAFAVGLNQPFRRQFGSAV